MGTHRIAMHADQPEDECDRLHDDQGAEYRSVEHNELVGHVRSTRRYFSIRSNVAMKSRCILTSPRVKPIDWTRMSATTTTVVATMSPSVLMASAPTGCLRAGSTGAQASSRGPRVSLAVSRPVR